MMSNRRRRRSSVLAILAVVVQLTTPGLLAGAAPCSNEPLAVPIVVQDLDDVSTLRNAVNCSDGETIEAVWSGSVAVNTTLAIGSGTVLIISGEEGAALVGLSALRLFEVAPGGGLNISRLAISGGSAENGAAIFSTSGAIHIEDCEIHSNVATSGGGGAILATRGVVTVSSSSFYNNTASTFGGAILASNVDLTVFDNSRFEMNSAIEGGAIYCAGLEPSTTPPPGESVTLCSLHGVTFVNNNASSLSPVDIDDFDQEALPSVGFYGGGAVSIQGATGFMRDCHFESNAAQVNGGGVFVGERTTAVIDGCTFVNNTAGGDGGAASVTTATFTGSTLFLGNKAESDGGAIFAWDLQGTIDLVALACRDNVAGGRGGCMHTAAETVVHEEVSMEGNIGNSGGCIYVADGANATVLGGNYTCTSTGSGGFLFLSEGGIAHVKGGLVTGCVAARRAGGIYCSGVRGNFPGSEITISGGIFRKNEALELGGVLMAHGTTVTILGGLFEENFARFFGGFLFLEEQASLSCDGATIRGNYAGDQGGGVYAREATWVNMTGCDIVTNIAPQGSGAYLTQVQSTQLQDMNVTANEVSAGSLVFIAGGEVAARNVTFGIGPRTESLMTKYAVESDNVARFRGDGCTFDGWDGDTAVYHGGDENYSLVLNGCDFRGSSSGMMIVSSYSDAVVRNAKVGEISFSNAHDALSLVDRALSCESPGVCGEGDCVDSPLGVLCECLPEIDGGMCLEDGPTLSLGFEAPPPSVTYSPDNLEFDLHVWAGNDGSTNTVWELAGFSDKLELELTPSSGILSPGEKTVVGILGTPADSNIGGKVSTSFVLTTVTDGEPVIDDATSIGDEERTTVELRVITELYLCDAFAVAIPDETNETTVMCELCSNLDGADGLDCANPGATLAALPIRRGYWRSDPASIKVHSCQNPDACVGGTRVSTSDDYCGRGYEGPYCAVCSAGYGRSWSDKCQRCDDENAKVLIVLTSAFFVVVAGLMVLAVVYLLGGLDAVGLLRESIASSFRLGGIDPEKKQRSVDAGGYRHTKSAEGVRETETLDNGHESVSGIVDLNGGSPMQVLAGESLAGRSAKVERVVPRATAVNGGAVETSGGEVGPETLTSTLVAWGRDGAVQDQAPSERLDDKSDGAFTRGSDVTGSESEGDRSTEGTGKRTTRRGCGTTIRGWLSRLPLDKLKILVVVWQILAAFPSIAAVRYPPVYAFFLSWIDVINFDLGRILSSSCLFPNTSHYERLLVATLGPLVLVLGLLRTYQIAMNRAGDGLAGVYAKRAASSRHMAACLLLTFMVFTSTSTSIFRTFACDDEAVEGMSFLRADYSLLCHTERHRMFKIYAGVMMVVYPIGIPLFYFYVLWKNRDALNPTVSSMKSLSAVTAGEAEPLEWEGGECLEMILERKIEQRRSDPNLMPTVFLWKDFVPELYYYEVIECGRRILLTGLLIFIAPYSSTTQVALACVFAFACLVAFELMRPHVDPSDIWLYRLGCTIIFLNNYLALLIKARDAGSDRLDALGVPIVLVNLALVAAVIVTSYIAMHQTVDEIRADDSTISVAMSMITTEHSLENSGTQEEQGSNKSGQQRFAELTGEVGPER